MLFARFFIAANSALSPKHPVSALNDPKNDVIPSNEILTPRFRGYRVRFGGMRPPGQRVRRRHTWLRHPAFQRRAAQRRAAQRHAAQRRALQGHAAQRHAAQRHAAQRRAAQRHALQGHAAARRAPAARRARGAGFGVAAISPRAVREVASLRGGTRSLARR